MIVFSVFIIFLLYYFGDIFSPWREYIHCPDASGGDFSCFGVSSVYRMSFALGINFELIFF